MALLLLGFPIAVALAWAFYITEKGVVRTAAKEATTPDEDRSALLQWLRENLK